MNGQDWDEVEALRASPREHMFETHLLRVAGRQALEPVTDCHEKEGGKLSPPLTAERLVRLKEMNERGTIRRGHVEEMLRALEAWHRSSADH